MSKTVATQASEFSQLIKLLGLTGKELQLLQLGYYRRLPCEPRGIFKGA